MKNKEFIYEYWGRTELGRKMIESNNVSDSDLLFLIPNNIKRMHGLPLTRISNKKKRKYKNQRKRHIMTFRLFDIIEEVVEERICSEWSQKEFFNEFVEVKNLNLGDSNVIYEEKKDKPFMRGLRAQLPLLHGHIDYDSDILIKE